jgi:hypothetical protein
MAYSYANRDEVKRCAMADFLNLFDALGGRRRQKALFCPFHSDRNPSASIFKSRYHCFGCGESMDVIAFVQRQLGKTFKGALEWLADYYEIPISDQPFSKSEKRKFASAKRRASVEALALTAWRRELIDSLRAERNTIWAGEQAACRWAREHMNNPKFDDDPRWELVWNSVKRQAIGDLYNRALNTIGVAPATELIRLWRAEQRKNAA